MKFSFNKCYLHNDQLIKGLYEIIPVRFDDNRGFFLESYNEKDFLQAGLNMKFVQENYSKSYKNVLRGLHFQKKNTQGKLIRISYGAIYDVVVDLRNGSETFGQYFGIILDTIKQNMLYIPKGFAHGFLVLSDYADLIYKCSDFYSPENETGIIWNDGSLAINWKDYVNQKDLIISNKDIKLPLFDKNQKYFDIDGNWIE